MMELVGKGYNNPWDRLVTFSRRSSCAYNTPSISEEFLNNRSVLMRFSIGPREESWTELAIAWIEFALSSYNCSSENGPAATTVWKYSRCFCAQKMTMSKMSGKCAILNWWKLLIPDLYQSSQPYLSCSDILYLNVSPFVEVYPELFHPRRNQIIASFPLRFPTRKKINQFSALHVQIMFSIQVSQNIVIIPLLWNFGRGEHQPYASICKDALSKVRPPNIGNSA